MFDTGTAENYLPLPGGLKIKAKDSQICGVYLIVVEILKP